MSEADLAELFADHAEAVITILFGYVSVVSGFLAATYLVAPAVPKILARLMLGLYSLTALAVIGYGERHAQVLISVRNELAARDANWHPAVSEPAFILPGLSYAIVVSMLAIYLGSIAYFYFARRSSGNEAAAGARQ